MNVEDIGGLYRVVISTGPGTHETVYATRNGEFIAPAVYKIDRLNRAIETRREFLECLETKGVKIYGALNVNSSDIVNASRLQLRILGGMDYMENIYMDCSRRMETCIDRGIGRLPSVKYKGKVYPGVKRYGWFRNVTNCSQNSTVL
ncbi:MAG: recombinase family protein [Candidatus Aenigmatarchaeota archaeon]